MPNPHFRVNHITRQKGQNAVASAAYRAGVALQAYGSPERAVMNAAAYRSGEALHDEQRGQVFSFVRKEGVLHTAIYVPTNAPEWTYSREKLWNEVERAEDKSTRRATARLARDFVASLPRELTHEQHRDLVEAFVAENFTSRGLVADVAFHSVKARDGGMNPHVHMMVATRNVNSDGFGAKARWLDQKDALSTWRNSWEKHTNAALETAGCEERLSLKSYKERGITLEGRKWLTREEYELEEKGIHTMRGDENRAIAERNRLAANDNVKPPATDKAVETWKERFPDMADEAMKKAMDAVQALKAAGVSSSAEASRNNVQSPMIHGVKPAASHSAVNTTQGRSPYGKPGANPYIVPTAQHTHPDAMQTWAAGYQAGRAATQKQQASAASKATVRTTAKAAHTKQQGSVGKTFAWASAKLKAAGAKIHNSVKSALQSKPATKQQTQTQTKTQTQGKGHER